MRSDKYDRAIKNYDGFKGDTTVNAVWKMVPKELLEQLTGKQIGLVMTAINKAYHAGRGSTGAEKLDDRAVYVDGIGIVDYADKK